MQENSGLIFRLSYFPRNMHRNKLHKHPSPSGQFSEPQEVEISQKGSPERCRFRFSPFFRSLPFLPYYPCFLSVCSFSLPFFLSVSFRFFRFLSIYLRFSFSVFAVLSGFDFSVFPLFSSSSVFSFLPVSFRFPFFYSFLSVFFRSFFPLNFRKTNKKTVRHRSRDPFCKPRRG